MEDIVKEYIEKIKIILEGYAPKDAYLGRCCWDHGIIGSNLDLAENTIDELRYQISNFEYDIKEISDGR